MTWLPRFLALLGLWVVLSGGAGLVVGVLAAGLATRASLALLPPGGARLRPVAIARIAAGVVWQTLTAGLDIARRAASPSMRLAPGLLRHPSGMPPGARQDAFRAVASLAPGALPVGADEDGALVVHLLDTGLPAAAQLARTEALFRHG